jgi:prepilin-type N-terminal cleavage/methylation domain-containing protein
MTKNYKKGFTLIELLVVIAIIGVLAAVVLSATNSARSKGDDAKIVSNIKTIQTQSAIYFDDNNAFYSPTATIWGSSNTTTCNSAGTFLVDPIISRAVTEILNNNSGSRMCNTNTHNGVMGYVSAWALVFPLKSQANTYWCIDSTGVSRKTHANGTAYNATSGSTPAALSNASDVTCN